MKNSSIITPKVAEGFVSRQTNLGIDSYDLDELYSPDTEMWKANALYLGSPKYPPQVASAPTRYWFDRSRYNSHIALTGATWKQLPSGVWVMSFDGDDYGKYTVADWRIADTLGSVSGWIKTSNTLQEVYFSSADEGSLVNYFWIGKRATGQLAGFTYDGTTNVVIRGSTNLADGAWHFWTVTTSGSAYTFWVDGNVETLTALAGTNTGNWFDFTINRDNLIVGAQQNSDGVSGYVTGTIGEIIYNSITWTISDHRRYYQQTKWRYR